MPPFNGDVSQTLLYAAKSTRSRDYKSACGLLYDLLMRNTDVLAFPPVALQRPESPTTAHEQTQVQNKTGGGAGLTNLRLACLPALPTPFSSSCTMEVSQLTTAQYSNLHSYYALSFLYVSAYTLCFSSGSGAVPGPPSAAPQVPGRQVQARAQLLRLHPHHDP